MSIEIALQTFYSESKELLEDFESLLLGLEDNSDKHDAETYNAIFRAIHTIKGSAGLFGLDEIVAFAHVVENLLDDLRAGSLKIDESLISQLLISGDHLSVMINESESGSISQETINTSETLLKDLNKFDPENKKNEAERNLVTTPELTVESSRDAIEQSIEKIPRSQSTDSECWHISLRFSKDCFRCGMDPVSFFRYLEKMGKIRHLETIDNNLPITDAFDPESCYLGFEIQFESDVSKEEIEDVFEFMRDDGELRIFAPHNKLSEYLEFIEKMEAEDLLIGEILVRCGALTERELTLLLQAQQRMENSEGSPKLGELTLEADRNLESIVEAAADKQLIGREQAAKDQQSLRVDAEKLDNLINLIGELVTAGAGAALRVKEIDDSELNESISTLNKLLEDVRDSALELRMVQIGATFNRFKRVVRDIAKSLEKDVELVITGADTELDKSVIEKISDPLTHLVRNALDHGIEDREERNAIGKDIKGTLELNAYHDSGYIIIEVADDGRGLNAENIKAKAIDKGLISAEDKLTENELYNLIFEPGFSTATSVSNISGRGVGMDVVKRNISDLRGRVEVESEINVGTVIRIYLPLTLAIIDGFHISVENNAFIVPLDTVSECIELDTTSSQAENEQGYTNLRGDVLPLVDLRKQFDIGENIPKRQSIVVVNSGGQRAGLVVDKLMGECQAVIKPLGKIFEGLSGVGGSTILGNGDVALILDVQGLLGLISNLQSSTPTYH